MCYYLGNKPFLLKDDALLENAKIICKDWQKVLRLQDWDISISVVRGKDMDFPDSYGLNSFDGLHKNSRIQIIDPLDLDEDVEFEENIVHELLHLHMADWLKDDGLTPPECEIAINILAQTLVGLKNGDLNDRRS